MFYYKKNFGDTSATRMPEPWGYQESNKAPYEEGKAAVWKWLNNPATDHRLISMIEGVTATLPVSRENPPWEMHGLIVDYDAKLPTDAVNYLGRNAPVHHRPTWLIRTSSDKGRLVWFFEHPVRFVNIEHHYQLMLRLIKTMKLNDWLGGFDQTALVNPYCYYEIGKEWTHLGPQEPIPTKKIILWEQEVFNKLRPKVETGKIQVNIPIEDVAKAVQERFPGRWLGDFNVGRHGVRFWAPEADNQNGVLVYPDGCRVYTPHDKPFMTWADIFGRDFVEKYVADKLASVSEKVVYDGKMFWRELPSQARPGQVEWQPELPCDFRQALICAGISAKKRSNGGSDIDVIEQNIKTLRRVTKIVPVVLHKPGPLILNGSCVLNICHAEVLKPGAPSAKPGAEWQDSSTRGAFPFVHRVLNRMFVDETHSADPMEDPLHPTPQQLYYLLAWMKHFYEHALNRRPQPGHALFLCGPVDKGKTFFSRALCGTLFGGWANGTPYFVQGSEFNKELAFAPVITIDDSEGAKDWRTHHSFEAKMKAFTANGSLPYRALYRDGCEIPHFGRSIITCNKDSLSQRILLSLDQSNKDKTMFLMAGTAVTGFFDWDENERRLRAELPAFARWLMEFDPFAYGIKPHKRFGIEAFHHPAMLSASTEQGTLGLVTEVLASVFCVPQGAAADPDSWWWGTGQQLNELMRAACPGAMKDLSYRAVVGALGQMERSTADVQSKRPHGVQCKLWGIRKAAFQLCEEGEKK